MMTKSGSPKGQSPSRLIDERIKELDDWRGKMLARLRTLIREADPEVVEEWKWGGPVWSHDGLICTGETYKNVVKMTFAKGAALDDPSGLFNAGLDGGTRRAIDIHEGAKIDAAAFKALVQAAVAFNLAKAESILDQYSANEIKNQMGNGANITIFEAGSTDAFSDEIKARYLGKPLWKYALMLSLVFLLAEVLLVRFLK